jgi:hypothetical protein
LREHAVYIFMAELVALGSGEEGQIKENACMGKMRDR